MSAGTTGGSDTGRNDCGIATGHAYSIIDSFVLNNGGAEIDMLMLRNPWGVTDYSADWAHDDENWTAENIAQVPFSIDPTTSHNEGIFFIPMTTFGNTAEDYNCIFSFEIAHMRDSEGYKDAWYDEIDNTNEETYTSFYITVPANDGALYFTVESYYQEIVPLECTTGTVNLGGGTTGTLTSPLLDYEVWKDGAASWTAYQYVPDQFSYPILITSYAGGDVFKVRVLY